MSRDAFPDDPLDTRDRALPQALERRPLPHPDVHGRDDRDSEARGGSQHPETRTLDPGDERDPAVRAYYVRDRAYLLRDSEIRSLAEIGTFRVVAVADLAQHAYKGDRHRMEKDVRHLRKQGLLTDRTVEVSRKKSLRVVTLTKAGHRLVKNAKPIPDDQAIYWGLRKPREVGHDADLYRLYQKEVARIAQTGARPHRVLLDYELKRSLNRDLALLGPDRDNAARKTQIAERHGLQLIGGKIPLPDLRIEYETAELELRHIDLELATREYRPRALAQKAAAGFSLYSRPGDAGRLRRILDERELTAAILTL
jgi:hypothetical protein